MTAGTAQNGGASASQGWQAFGSEPVQPAEASVAPQDPTAGDEELARKLQDMWNKEDGVSTPTLSEGAPLAFLQELYFTCSIAHLTF